MTSVYSHSPALETKKKKCFAQFNNLTEIEVTHFLTKITYFILWLFSYRVFYFTISSEYIWHLRASKEIPFTIFISFIWQRYFIFIFSLQMSTTGRAGPGQSQETRNQLEFLMYMAESRQFCHHWLLPGYALQAWDWKLSKDLKEVIWYEIWKFWDAVWMRSSVFFPFLGDLLWYLCLFAFGYTEQWTVGRK